MMKPSKERQNSAIQSGTFIVLQFSGSIALRQLIPNRSRWSF